ncbi:hypothetical protein [Kocuria rosea]|uniref:hypothetical protein n=1 Tax=Kocuria rosea TaxID=1275 RepID=UPI0025B75093|nr:hypothetical protein [Kocuria rosea]WJZ68355.1 hypothetical protein QR564_18055 [Kocuria rosea]
MIPNNVPEISAFFDSDGGRFKFPVIAWDDQGRALIADADGTLIIASETPHFEGLTGVSKETRRGPRRDEEAPKQKRRAAIL